MKSNLLAFLFGALFAAGLALAGMTSADKVIAFLDVFGSWDPSLALVMIGAIGTYLPLQLWIRRRRAPVLATRFVIPKENPIDARLVAGAALFGVGWGLVGYCPAPAIASLATGTWQPLAFVGGMLLALGLYELVRAKRRGSAATVRDSSVPA